MQRVHIHPYDYKWRDARYGTTMRVVGNVIDVNYTGDILFPPYNASSSNVVNVSPNVDLRSRARVEALLKVADKKIDIGVALGESRTTARHLTSVVARFYGAYKAARRGHWERARKILGVNGKSWKEQSSNVSSAWLEYSYAWVPLFSDIFGLQEQLKEGFKQADQLFSVVRYTKTPIDPRSYLSPVQLRSNPTLGVSIRKAEQFHKTKYYCRVQPNALHALTVLGLTNPLNIAWELVPFSFVVDWFLPIGDFLNASAAIQGVDFVSGHESYGSMVDVDFEWLVGGFIGNAANLRVITSGTPPKITVQSFTTKRDVLFSWGLSGVRPYSKDPFSLAHAATTAALVRKLA